MDKTLIRYDYLLTISGFGPDVSSKVLAAIGDPFRFNSASQVLKMAGMDLNAERSGKSSDTAVPIISKKGSGHLRYALYQAAFIASTRNKLFKKYYAHILTGREKEKGIKTKMRVKLVPQGGIDGRMDPHEKARTICSRVSPDRVSTFKFGERARSTTLGPL